MNKLADSFYYFEDHDSLAMMDNSLVISKKIGNRVIIINEYGIEYSVKPRSSVQSLPKNGMITHIKKYNKEICIILSKATLFSYNLIDREMKELENSKNYVKYYIL